MLQNLINAWRTPDLRMKLIFTAAMLAIYRLGSFVPAPGVNSDALSSALANQGGIFGLLSVFSGGGLARLGVFALGIMPYITASIILQVMTPVFPTLQALQKEGELGQRRITQYTRYLTVALAGLQALGYTYAFHSNSLGVTTSGSLINWTLGNVILIVITLTAGATLLMWVGELITQRGVGNGMSLLIFASILTSAPAGISAWWNGSTFEKLSLPIVVFGVIVAVVFVQEGIRKIPIQYAKRMVGRRMTTGGSTYLPLRVNMAGVIPVIFAAAIMAFPPTVGQIVPWTIAHDLARFLQPGGWPFLIGEATLIFGFTFFYVAVIFNSIEQADNLKKNGGFVPGVRPGRPTAQYLERVLVRLTVAGGLFLALVAVLPSLFIKYGGFSQATGRALGGTSVLIVVGVAIDTMRQIESQLSMRAYKGFLK
ncbi:MAG TPA: preprotein translocase subunit SecY [Gaiellales bacterium]|jgi:preprotein translocase subunit SecY|nr:preprotein translocase subunit SecY [Gaiellales bacterium]